LKKRLFISFSLLALVILLASWGATGHSKISQASSLSFNQQMQGFYDWVTFLTDHASDADYRKNTDPTEAPKHYIDIDNYPEFVATGRIPQTYDSIVALYGITAVIDNGILPWATEASFDSLRDCMQRLDFEQAKIYAADLGHYLADGHMPLHITKNYNGQLSGNTGIHSRYESTMINGFIGQFNYTGTDATEVENVNQFIFDYLYENYIYCDSIFAADNYAKSQSSNYSSSVYKNALWQKSSGFTIPLFQRASHAFADLIYTAWLQAGSPPLQPTSVADLNPAKPQLSVSPNPFAFETYIRFTLHQNCKYLIQIYNLNGDVVETLADTTGVPGTYSLKWDPAGKPTGVYIAVLNTGTAIESVKLLHL